jgi:hypothetical protein
LEDNNEKQICFWNGNKSSTRRDFESQLLALCLSEANCTGADVIVDNRDYPKAEDEGNIFSKGCDVLISVAGNQKFLGKPAITLDIPICRGILGHRLLIIRKEQAKRFADITCIEQLKQMAVGIPATWADADLFRKNGFKVSEKGSLNDLFTRLLAQQFDYIALGSNEIESIFENIGAVKEALLIQPSLLIYYPLPLIFYIHPQKLALANTIECGLKSAIANGKHARLFEQHHPNIIKRLGLRERRSLVLSNPYLPDSLKDFRPKL